MTKSTLTQRVKQLEAEVATLREQINKLLGARRDSSETHIHNIKRLIGLRP